MSEARRFKLVFLLQALDFCEARRELLGVLNSVTARGLLDSLDSPPIIRIAQPRYDEWDFFDFD